MFKALLKRIPFAESIRAFLEQWGIWAYINLGWAALMGGLWGLWAWLESNLPYWAIGLIFAAVVSLMLIATNFSIEIWRKYRAESINEDNLSDELITLSDEISRSFNDYIRERRDYKTLILSNDDVASLERWQKKRDLENQLTRHVAERYGARIVAAVATLNKLDIKIPFHLSHMSEHTILGLASFLGAVGHLIKTGNIAVAQKLDDESTWTISNLIR